MPDILIIDDSIEVRRVIARVLRLANYRVTEAANGAIGLKLCRDALPALVITDMVMPEKDGFETIEQLRRQMPKLPILAISGGGMMDYLAFAARLGATAVLQKPFKIEDLLETVARLINGPAQTCDTPEATLSASRSG